MPRLLPFALTAALSTFALGSLQAELQTVELKTMTGQMRYDKSVLAVKPGDEVKIIFENTDDLPHNFVLCEPGTNVIELADKQMEKPEEAVKNNWLPMDKRIVAHTKLLNPHEKEEITIKLPEKPAIFPYVCTFPGHSRTMNGQLSIVSQGPGLSDLSYQLYLGAWKKLPDFTGLKPHREGPLPKNLVELKIDDYQNDFGVVYKGKLTAPQDGIYRFFQSSDDGTRLFIDDKKVVEIDGVHPSGPINYRDIKLLKGDHVYRMEYFQAAGEAELFSAWSGPGFSITALSSWRPEGWDGKALKPKADNTIGMPLIVKDEALIYRNFIRGAGQRGIGVGYPGQMNLAWNAEYFNLPIIWRGAFIDAARHWVDRGGGEQAPLGYDVTKMVDEGTLPFSVMESESAPWPKLAKGQRSADYQWKGYELDAKRQPTFMYQWKGLNVSDHFDATGNAGTGEGKWVRTIKIDGAIPANAFFVLATAKDLKSDGDAFTLEQSKIQSEGARKAGDKLIVPAKSSFTITYSWVKPILGDIPIH